MLTRLQIVLRYLRRGVVQKRYRVTKRRQLVLFEQCVRQGVVELFGRQRAPDQFAQRVLAHARGGGIHRRQRLSHGCSFLHHAIARMHHFRTEEALPYFAERANARTGLEMFDLTAVEAEKSQRHRTAAVFEVAHQLAARAVLDVALDHRGFDQHLAPGGRIFDGI